MADLRSESRIADEHDLRARLAAEHPVAEDRAEASALAEGLAATLRDAARELTDVDEADAFTSRGVTLHLAAAIEAAGWLPPEQVAERVAEAKREALAELAVEWGFGFRDQALAPTSCAGGESHARQMLRDFADVAEGLVSRRVTPWEPA